LPASDIIGVLPLTDQILMIQRDDGYVQYHGKRQERTHEQAITDPLNTELSENKEIYTIFSYDHVYYKNGIHPEAAGRK
jgi:hypothetical protein